jgi:SAM-dependent methyltransferase
MHDWFETPPGRYLLAWEQAQLDLLVADVFGYHAVQLGLPELAGLRANRMPHRWLGLSQPHAADASAWPAHHFVSDFAALPFAEASLDLLVLPHSLELDADAHATLREVERVLVPEGRVVICGLNPASLWGLRQRRARLYQGLGFGQLYLPDAGEFIGYWRLRDWLRLLSFEVESARFGCWRPAFRSQNWLQRTHWLDPLGERWWPIFGAAYCVVAVKKVRGMKLLGPSWKNSRKLSGAPAPVSVVGSTNFGDTNIQHRKADETSGG